MKNKEMDLVFTRGKKKKQFNMKVVRTVTLLVVNID